MHANSLAKNLKFALPERHITITYMYGYPDHRWDNSYPPKGLSFVPMSIFNTFTWVRELHLFVRKLKWHKFFKAKD